MQTMNTSKLNYLLVFVLVALFGFSATAQDYTFKVISKKGSATVGGEELKVGSKIQTGQSITVGAGTLLNIAHNNGKSLNISKAGNYQADDLAKGCLVASGSLAGKYADFVLKELTSSDDNGVRGKNMRKPGSVVRGEVEISKPLMFMANTEKTPVMLTSVTLRCFTNDSDKAKVKVEESEITKYTFVIKDLGGTELAKIESDKPTVNVDMSDEKFANAMGAIMYHAYVNDNPELASVDYVLQPMKGDTAREISQNVEELSADNSAVGKLILARFFEEHGMHANALYAYEQALELSDQDARYESMYQSFLDRNYLSKQKKTEANQ